MDPKHEIDYEAPAVEDREQIKAMLGMGSFSKKALKRRRRTRATFGMRASHRTGSARDE